MRGYRLRQVKRAAALRNLKPGKERTEIQVWLNALPPDKIEALRELGWVRRVEPPRFR